MGSSLHVIPQRPSFISEHTAEFYLIPRFQEVLSSTFYRSLPFFFWSSREGNSKSRDEDSGTPVRLCALFPRRPKLGDGGHVMMKVNEEVLEMASELMRTGIPSFLGIPLVHSFYGLRGEFTCLWFSVMATEQIPPEWEVDCEDDMVLPGNQVLRGPCQEGEICQIVRSQSPLRGWREVVELINIARNAQRQLKTARHPYFYGPRYKPVYFLLC